MIITMCKLIFAMALGFFLNKKDILDSHTSKKLSSFIVNVTCPMLIISSISSVEGDQGNDIIFLLLAGIITYTILPIFSYLVCKVLRTPKDCTGTYRCMIIFSNNSFMGFPVVEALFGPIAIFYTTIFHFGFNILYYSYGLFLMGRDAGKVKKFNPRNLINIGMFAGILALIIYFGKIPIPDVVISPLTFIGSVTTPLSMLVIGSNMAGCPLKELFTERKIYAITLIRLIVIPIIAYAVITMFTSQQLIIGVVTMTLGMPIASMVAMGSCNYEKQGRIASLAVVMTTICSMITIPLIALLIQ